MQKIMFNDKYGLNQAVLDGRKTKTRRIVTDRLFQECRSNGLIDAGGFNDEWKTKSMELLVKNSPYKVGEEVAIAQSHNDCLSDSWITHIHEVDPDISYDRDLSLSPGASNKMFVRAALMPHRIKITDIRVERLQDISDEDCMAEGVKECSEPHIVGYPFGVPFRFFISEDKPGNRYSTPREAFAALIDKVSGKGTWNRNPYVFVYEFKLIK